MSAPLFCPHPPTHTHGDVCRRTQAFERVPVDIRLSLARSSLSVQRLVICLTSMRSATGPAPCVCVFPHTLILSRSLMMEKVVGLLLAQTFISLNAFSEDQCEQLRCLCVVITHTLVCETFSVLTSGLLVAHPAGTDLKLSRSSGLIVKIVYV